ncbi:MAG: hypothetical protein NZ853_02070 [Leptospiraceae bacterium]|nr:hypothetical protein [Leptospiraceae bacterium]MDW7975988.1 hypothetical protein [Leptospiraceae bacterium]
MEKNEKLTGIQEQEKEKVVTIPIKEINQLKVILAIWYSYVLSKSNESFPQQSAQALKTPIVYNIEKDELELILSGTEEMLKELTQHIQQLNQTIKQQKK